MSMRHDDAFSLFWNHMEILRVHTNSDEAVLPRKKKTPKCFEVGKESVAILPQFKIIFAGYILKLWI